MPTYRAGYTSIKLTSQRRKCARRSDTSCEKHRYNTPQSSRVIKVLKITRRANQTGSWGRAGKAQVNYSALVVSTQYLRGVTHKTKRI